MVARARRGRGERGDLPLRDADARVLQHAAASVERAIGEDDDGRGRWSGYNLRGER